MLFRYAYRLLFVVSVSFPCATYAVTNWVDFELINGHINLPVSIAGIEGKAILDSGAQINAINTSFINRHNLSFKKSGKVNVQGVYGTQRHQMYSDVMATLFGAEIELDKLASMRIGHHETQLILGASLMQRFIFQIDYPNSRLRLFERDNLDMTQFENIDMQINRSDGQPIVKVELNGQKSVWLVMDTGNNGGLFLKRSMADDLGWLEEYATISGESRGANKLGLVEHFQLPGVKFGPYIVENVMSTVPAKGQRESVSGQQRGSMVRLKGKNIKGLIGYDVLKHFVLTIDYKSGHMHVGLPEES
ncbi:pepsin/retropepsin-like aspartic protease family protein [Shewanella waksmanii]|uniref:pepsin/retropepsin-like aspartic protease family protein n=1 Tax=Shewanella waksmanii TaxID=213783 RepID=UPI00048A7F2F|nr:pepsin/retropepsin-like aspartic protease family protein [Shewanella waksmanii]